MSFNLDEAELRYVLSEVYHCGQLVEQEDMEAYLKMACAGLHEHYQMKERAYFCPHCNRELLPEESGYVYVHDDVEHPEDAVY